MTSLIFLCMVVLASAPRLSSDENYLLKAMCGAERLGKISYHGGFRSKYKSIGGRILEINEYPWNVFIFYRNGDVASSCSGSLISRRHVLTAAHCMGEEYDREQCILPLSERKPKLKGNENYTIYVGTKCPYDSESSRKYHIAEVWVPSSWERCGVKHDDIAIIELEDNVSTKEAQPICVPAGMIELERKLKVSGWGRDNPPDSSINLAVVEFTEHEEFPELEKIITFSSSTKATCPGDSGASIFQRDNSGRYVILGVHNSGTDCSRRQLTNASIYGYKIFNHFADARYKVGWICEKTGICPIVSEWNDFYYDT